MADLHKRDDREDWLKWAIEFIRRGIWPEDYITVHGPHSPYDLMWGEMGDHTFRTVSGVSGIHDVRGVRIRDDSNQACPILPPSELEARQRKWLLAAQRTLAKLRGNREQEEREITVLRNRWKKSDEAPD